MNSPACAPSWSSSDVLAEDAQAEAQAVADIRSAAAYAAVAAAEKILTTAAKGKVDDLLTRGIAEIKQSAAAQSLAARRYDAATHGPQ